MARPNNVGAIGAYLDGKKEAVAKFAALPPFMQEKRIAVNSATAAALALGAQQHVISSPSIQTRSLLTHIKWSINTRTGESRTGVTSGSTVLNVRPGVRSNVRVKGIVIAGKFGNSALKKNGARLIRPSRYAHLIEFGWTHAEAEPFMIPATDAQKQPHLQRWRAAGRELERHMAQVGGTMPSIGGGRL